jgi:2,5-furandicarboxylate decarboxylase 1
MAETKLAEPKIDLEKFRLRTFVKKLMDIGELEVVEKPVELMDLCATIEQSPKALLFRQVGAEKYEMISGLVSSRRRIAAVFGCDEKGLLPEFMKRAHTPHPVVDVASKDAPVHQVVIKGDDVDLTKLPFHLQHELDGAPYISSAIDFTIDPATGKPNVGCRRLMLKGKRELRTNLTQMSDLKRIYLEALKRRERLPLSFVIGSHPADFISAALKIPMDEFQCIGAMRGAPVPMVKGITNGIPVPADAEIVIEGYLDETGYSELEGPYGELYGYYGPMHIDPVFHATAITMRRDPLHHTVLHGGRYLIRNDATQISCLYTEAMVRRTLGQMGIEVTAVRPMAGATGLHTVRVAIRQTEAGQARKAIEALMKLPLLRFIYVVDHDVDLWSEDDWEWAMCARFRIEKDLITEGGHFALSMDPAIDEQGKQTKGGYDMTAPFPMPEGLEARRSDAPRARPAKGGQTVMQALQGGPKYFIELMEATGSRDGRDLVVEIEKLRAEGALNRTPNGQWCLKGTPNSQPAIVPAEVALNPH